MSSFCRLASSPTCFLQCPIMLRSTPHPARYVGCAVWYAVPVCATIQLCIGCTTERDHELFSCSTRPSPCVHSRNGKDGWYRLCAPRCKCVGCTLQCGLYRGLGGSAPTLFLTSSRWRTPHVRRLARSLSPRSRSGACTCRDSVRRCAYRGPSMGTSEAVWALGWGAGCLRVRGNVQPGQKRRNYPISDPNVRGL
jgi:hypothetical protein